MQNDDDRKSSDVLVRALPPGASESERLSLPAAARTPADWPLLPVATLLSLCWAAFCWPWLSGAVTIPWDAKAHFLPQIQFLAASLARGELPFWTPNVFAGHPQIADPQSMMFSPPILLLALLDPAPSLWSTDTTVLLVVLLGGIGVLLLGRDWGWHWAGALVAAIAFQYGGSMAWRIQHFGQVMSLCYLPFALFFLGRALDRSSTAYGAAAGLTAAFIVLGRDQVGLSSLYLLAGYVVWYWLTAPSKKSAIVNSLRPLMAGGAVGLAIVVIPVILTLLLATESNRPSIDFVSAGRGSLHPALLVTSTVPHIFGAAGPMEKYWGPPSFTWTGTDLFIAQNVGQLYLGAIPLFLLAIGLVRGVFWDRQIRFVTFAAIFALLYALGWYTPVFRLMYEALPGVDLYRRPADATFLLGAMGALLAGYVMHRMMTKTLPPASLLQQALTVGLIAFPFVLCLVFAQRFDRIDMAVDPLLLGFASVAVSGLAFLIALRLKAVQPVLAAGIIVVALTADLAINNGPNGATALPPSDIAMLEPDTDSEVVWLLKERLAKSQDTVRRDRVELAGLGFHWPNASLTHGFDNTLGYNPVRLDLYTKATGAGDTVGLPDQRKFTPLFPSYRSTLADLLGLRFIATGVPIEKIDHNIKPGDLTLLAHTADGYVYENPRALPRVLFANRAMKTDFDQLLADGNWPDADLRTTVLLDTDPPAEEMAPGTVQLRSYSNTEVVIEADSPDGGWVVLLDVWHPWWSVEVDGYTDQIQRANVLFRAVEVPPGTHTVRFVFRPFWGAFHQLWNSP
jgi:hypothetical protein